MNKKYLLFYVVLLCLIITPFVFSDSNLPPGLLRIQEQNLKDANFFLQNISFVIAFLAGVLSVLSPCILPLLPAFFSYTFKEKRNITKMTFVFFLGFSLIFVLLGIIASFLGTSLSLLQIDYQILIFFAGVFLIILGVMSLIGKGFSSFIRIKSVKNDSWGVFILGISFAFGWTACLGPILGGVLLMASVLHNFIYAALLLLMYSFGIFLPLFLISFLYDKYNLQNSKFVKGKILNFFGLKVHSTNLIAGLLLIVIGIIFMVYQSTSFINVYDPFKTKELFYILQDKLMQFSIINYLGVILLIIVVYLLYRFLKKK